MSEIRLSVLDQLDLLEEIMLEGSRIPFSGGRLVNEQDAVELLDAVRDAMPGQVAEADQLLRSAMTSSPQPAVRRMRSSTQRSSSVTNCLLRPPSVRKRNVSCRNARTDPAAV